MNRNELFYNLNKKGNFFVLANVWDVLSAKLYEKNGYKAIGTSSAALSLINGEKDGENISFKQVLDNAKNIVLNVSIPLSVDIEKGYSTSNEQIISNVLEIASIGCSGINIEDSTIDGKLRDVTDFSFLLQNIKKELLNAGYDQFIINARTDTYIHLNKNDQLKETIKRAKLYQKHGANSLFVPCLSDIKEIKIISKEIDIPLNIMNVPNLKDLKSLAAAGVTRLSLGDSAFNFFIAHIEQNIKKNRNTNNYSNYYKLPLPI